MDDGFFFSSYALKRYQYHIYYLNFPCDQIVENMDSAMESLSGHSWLNKSMDYFFDAPVYDTWHKEGIIMCC